MVTYQEVQARKQKQFDEKRREIYKTVGLDYDKAKAKAKKSSSRQATSPSAESSTKKDVPVIESSSYNIKKVDKSGKETTEKVSQSRYEKFVREQESKGVSFSTSKRVASSGLTTARKYDPRTGKYYDINPKTGVRKLEVKKYSIGDRKVSKDEYDKYVESKLKEGETLRVSTSRPGTITGKDTKVSDVDRSDKYWDPQKQMADRYIREHPGMTTKNYFTSIKDQEGKIVGYSDVLAKKSVLLKQGESVTEKSLRTASKRASALVNIEKDKEHSPNKYGAEEITEAPKKRNVFSAFTEKGEVTSSFISTLSTKKIKEMSERSQQKFLEAQSIGLPLVAGVYAIGYYGGVAVSTVADAPKNLALAIGLGAVAFKDLAISGASGVVSSVDTLRSKVGTYEKLTGDNVDIKDVDAKTFSKALKDTSSVVGGVVSSAITTTATAGATIGMEVLSKAGDDPVKAGIIITSNIVAPTIWARGVQYATKVGTNILAELGLTYRDPSDVFSPQSLASKGRLPTTKSSAETISAFKQTASTVDRIDDVPVSGAGYSEVVPEEYLTAAHISQADLGRSGSFQSGEAGLAGVQDDLFYVTAEGRLSPLRMGDSGSSISEYSFNPIKWLESFKSGSAKGYLLRFKNIENLPDEVLAQPGFSGVKTYTAGRVGSETAFVTKRSTIGHGEIQPQVYTVADDFTLKGKTTKAGSNLFERGTSEHEAGFPIPDSYEFGAGRSNVVQRLLKAEEYTYYGDKLVLLTRGRVLPGTGLGDDIIVVSSTPVKESVSNAGEVLTGKQIVSSSGYVDPNVVYIDPVSSGASFIGSSEGRGVSSVVSSTPSGSSVDYSKGFSPELSPVTPSSPSSSVVDDVSYISPSPSSKISSSSGRSGRVSGGSSVSSPVSDTSPSLSPVTPSSSTPSGSSVDYSKGFSPELSPVTPSSSTPSGFSFKKSKSSFGSLFSPQVRKRGRWVTVSPGFGFSKSEALHKGLFVAGHSARASVRVVESKSSKKKRFYGKGIIGDFYKKGNVFIEKRSRRIKSRGELEDITYKGQRARKNTPLKRSIMSKMKLWGK